MAVNKRLIFWLFKAYIKRWRKTIIFFFVLGLLFFFFLRFFFLSLLTHFPIIQKETIGAVGAYTIDTLPPFILDDASRGLTKVDASGTPHPDVASSWNIQDSGKTYVFHLRPNQYFDDGTQLTSSLIRLPFSDVSVARPNTSTIVFHLKQPYTPFLISVSQPIFKEGFVGLGQYQVKHIELNGTFVSSITLVDTKQQFLVKVYSFYPTQESLRLAFVLGNVTQMIGLTDLSFENTSLTHFSDAKITKEINYSQLVTLFYNTQDKNLSDKRLRDGLSYALPNAFSQGQRADSPIAPTSWAYQQQDRTQDLDHARLLLKAVQTDDKKLPTVTISALPKYKEVADTIAKAWDTVGVTTKVEIVDSTPTTFEIFLGNFNVPKDPDQYTLWHSDQINNITGYKSLRIDKLLEDGRDTQNLTDRVSIYSDFQKYLLDDQPASFLYFPYTYTVTRV